jgi:hypothetical protein
VARTGTWKDERRAKATLKAYGKPMKGSALMRQAAVPGPHANAVLRHLFQLGEIRPIDAKLLNTQKVQFQSLEWALVEG